MIKKSVAVEAVIELLNELLEIDSDAVSNLVLNRVECNEELADHSTVQVAWNKEDDTFSVGLLGILNGLFGIDSCGYGAICVEITDGKIIKFSKLNV